MKYNKKFYGMAMAMLAGGALVSCTNQLNEPVNSESIASAIKLVKAPEVYAYSGGEAFGTKAQNLPMAYTNAGDGYINNPNWEGYNGESLTNITEDEKAKVLKAIDDKTDGSKISEDLVFPWTAYFLQDVITMENGNYTNAGNNGMKDVSVNYLEAYNKGAKCDQQYSPGYDFEDYETITNSKKLNTYFQKQTADGQERINQTALMKDMTVGTYEEMRGHQFRVWVNCHISDHYYDYIIVNVDGSYYICFDFGCGTEEHDKDGDPGRGATFNDWDYNDWILKITPAGNQPDVWSDAIETPDPDPTPGEGDDNQDQLADVPDHVEVNLSLEERLSYLTSHLSIHVRAVTDVEVFIPIPATYVCEADDLDIVQKHQEDLMVHGGPTRVEYNIHGNTVTLTLEVKAEGIYVTTDGINEDVIAYLKETYNDGITFEVWNYFNIKHSDWTNLTHDYLELDELKDMMNQSTVKFLDNTPSLYVNAFMYETGDAEYHEGH